MLGERWWSSPLGDALTTGLLKHDSVAEYYEPRSHVTSVEMWGRLASLLSEAALSVNPTEALAGTEHVEALVGELTGNPIVQSVWLVADLDVTEALQLDTGTGFYPITDDVLDSELTEDFLGKAVTVPKAASAVIALSTTLERAEWGSAATFFLSGMSELQMQRLASSAWIATGRRPMPVARMQYEVASYPAVRSIVRRADAQELAALQGQPEGDPLVLERLRPTAARMVSRPWDDPEMGFDAETASVIEHVMAMVDTLFSAGDALVTSLLCFSAMEAMVSNKGDGTGVIFSRLAELLSSDSGARGKIRGRLQALYDVRGDVAHGRVAKRADIRVAIGPSRAGALPPEDDWFSEAMLLAEFRWSCLRLLRATLGCFLYVTVDVDESESPKITPGLSHGALVSLLTAATQGDDGARQRLDEALPGWLREPS